MPSHFLTGAELTPQELEQLLAARRGAGARGPLRSDALEGRSDGARLPEALDPHARVLRGRRRTSSAAPLILRSDEMQLSRGEALRDTALVLSRHVAAVGVRTGPQAMLEELARRRHDPRLQHADHRPPPLPGARRPADPARDLRYARRDCGSPTSATATTSPARWRVLGAPRGDRRRGRLARGLLAGAEAVAAGGGERDGDAYEDPREAVTGACAVYTDVWVRWAMSPGAGAPPGDCRPTCRRRTARPAADDAFAMHDLPAHAGEEISAEVLYGPRQRIWDQAENRRHAQKALLELLVGAEQRGRRGEPTTTSAGDLDPVRARGRRRAPAEVESLAFGGDGRRAAPTAATSCSLRARFPAIAVRARRAQVASAPTRRRARSRCRARAPSGSRRSPSTRALPWQVLPYERQLEIKQEQVDDALRRIGRLDGYRARADRPGRGAVALPQQARVLVRHRRGRRRSCAASTRPGPLGRSTARGLPAGLGAGQPPRGCARWCRAGARRSTAASRGREDAGVMRRMGVAPRPAAEGCDLRNVVVRGVAAAAS